MTVRALHETAWTPSEEQRTGANIARFMSKHGLGSYAELRAAWTADAAWFWGTMADELGIHWFERPHTTLDVSRGVAWARWFPGGITNVVSSCVDRHDPESLAYVGEGEEGDVSRMTFGELSDLVSRIAGELRRLGVRREDRVGLYLPLTPEAYACMYACAKIGAVAVPMFSGFGVAAIVARLQDAGASVLISADAFLRRGKVIPMREIAEAAARESGVEQLIVWPRLGEGSWDAVLAADPVREAEPVPADHPFLIAYTSGTTGKPRGAVHTHAGFPLKTATETFFHCDQRDGELLCWLTDLGWIMAPLTMAGAGLTGRPLFLYDGAPDHPTPGRVRELIDRHELAILGASPTYVRALMGQPDHGFDTSPSSLRILCSTGEAWNEVPWWWYFERVGGGRCPVVNVAGGTEAGSFLGVLPIRPLKPCSFNSTCVGVDAAVYRADGSEAEPGEVGELVVRQPWPGMTKSFWNDDERYLDSYWSRWPDVWVHGDWASRDADGNWWLHGRSDDTMMIAGKRVGPAEVESALVKHDAVIEAAAIGVPDELKGESIWCFVVAPRDVSIDEDDLRSFVGTQLGKAFTPRRVIAVSLLPRTRNGKVLRRAIRAVVTGESQGDLSSLDNPGAIAEIQSAVESTAHVLEGR